MRSAMFLGGRVQVVQVGRVPAAGVYRHEPDAVAPGTISLRGSVRIPHLVATCLDRGNRPPGVQGQGLGSQGQMSFSLYHRA
jgi:hypothetical protein